MGKKGTEGKGSSQGTCMDDPWTGTTGRGLTGSRCAGRTGESNGEKIGTNVIEQQ